MIQKSDRCIGGIRCFNMPDIVLDIGVIFAFQAVGIIIRLDRTGVTPLDGNILTVEIKINAGD